jgi:signal peptidase II
MPDYASTARSRKSSEKPEKLDLRLCPAWVSRPAHTPRSKGVQDRLHAAGEDLIKENAKAFPRSFVIISLLAIVADQLSKTLATSLLAPGESVPVLGDFFRLTLVLNPGGVFGTRLGSQNFYTFISIFAIGITLWFFFKTSAKRRSLRVGLSLVLGGAVGNLIDRFRFGEVVDFLDFEFFNISLAPAKFAFFRFPGFCLDRWPVFNLADSFVLIGIILVVAHLLFSKESPTTDTPQDSDAAYGEELNQTD